ncbi:hypothetical protein SB6411_03211 [Klebsiella spallanzanii]|uniref:FidL-like membrane protein n=1 Tax=Klebsiella spallanzanii TaxID=2587528 RepID=A0ABY6VJB0_9ENTR|nr:hypothetical protein [Klebsiella spallanzanii]VUS85447.1 hypothetical protein SB6411_03211 [Klebsiella spallanzanii]
MNKKLKYVASFFLMIVLILSATIFQRKRNEIDNFKCTNQSRYYIFNNDVEYDFYVVQTLQLYNDNTGFISFNGKVIREGITQSVSRKILLNDGKKIDGHTFKYRNGGIRKLSVDYVDDKVFRLLLSEVSIDDSIIIFERQKVDSKAWLIGNPDAWVLTCVEY